MCSSANMQGVGFMTYSAASPQGATETFLASLGCHVDHLYIQSMKHSLNEETALQPMFLV